MNSQVKSLPMASDTTLHFSQKLGTSTRSAALSLTDVAIRAPWEVVAEAHPSDDGGLQEGHHFPTEGNIVEVPVADSSTKLRMVINVPFKALFMVSTEHNKTRSAVARSSPGKEVKSFVTCSNVESDSTALS